MHRFQPARSSTRLATPIAGLAGRATHVTVPAGNPERQERKTSRRGLASTYAVHPIEDGTPSRRQDLPPDLASSSCHRTWAGRTWEGRKRSRTTRATLSSTGNGRACPGNRIRMSGMPVVDPAVGSTQVLQVLPNLPLSQLLRSFSGIRSIRRFQQPVIRHKRSMVRAVSFLPYIFYLLPSHFPPCI